MSKLLTLYTVTTGTSLEMEIGLLATFVERVARLPPLYPAGDSDINFPFEIELFARFDDDE